MYIPKQYRFLSLFNNWMEMSAQWAYLYNLLTWIVKGRKYGGDGNKNIALGRAESLLNISTYFFIHFIFYFYFSKETKMNYINETKPKITPKSYFIHVLHSLQTIIYFYFISLAVNEKSSRSFSFLSFFLVFFIWEWNKIEDFLLVFYFFVA